MIFIKLFLTLFSAILAKHEIAAQFADAFLTQYADVELLPTDTPFLDKNLPPEKTNLKVKEENPTQPLKEIPANPSVVIPLTKQTITTQANGSSKVIPANPPVVTPSTEQTIPTQSDKSSKVTPTITFEEVIKRVERKPICNLIDKFILTYLGSKAEASIISMIYNWMDFTVKITMPASNTPARNLDSQIPFDYNAADILPPVEYHWYDALPKLFYYRNLYNMIVEEIAASVKHMKGVDDTSFCNDVYQLIKLLYEEVKYDPYKFHPLMAAIFKPFCLWNKDIYTYNCHQFTMRVSKFFWELKDIVEQQPKALFAKADATENAKCIMDPIYQRIVYRDFGNLLSINGSKKLQEIMASYTMDKSRAFLLGQFYLNDLKCGHPDPTTLSEGRQYLAEHLKTFNEYK